MSRIVGASIRTVAVLSLAACGGGGPSGPNTSSPFTAVIDGVPWSAQPSTVTAVGRQDNAYRYTYTLSGSDVGTAGSSRGVALAIANVVGPGTYPFGVDQITVVGAYGTVSENGNSWQNAFSGRSGSVTITTLTTTRIAGHFTFMADPWLGNVTNTRSVTSGQFDLPLTLEDTPLAFPPNAFSRMSGTIGGEDWAAFSVIALSTNGLVVQGSSNNFGLTFSMLGPVAPGVYQVGSQATEMLMGAVAGTTSSGPAWGLMSTGNVGTVTIASANAFRVTGSFSATLAPIAGTGATAPLTVNGTFDLGLDFPPIGGMINFP